MRALLTILLSVCMSYAISEMELTLLDLYEDEDGSGNLPNTFDSYKHMTDLEEYPNVCDEYQNEQCAKAWIDEVDKVGCRNANRMANLGFALSTNITKANEFRKLKFRRKHIKLERRMKEKLRKFKWNQFKSPKTKRIFQLMTPTIESGNRTIPLILLNISTRIKSIYNHAQACFGRCLDEGEADIVELFRKERDYDKLEGFWLSWSNVTGRKIKKLFVERIKLENIGAKENGYPDAASFKLKKDFEEDRFNGTAVRLYEEILPLYKQLHGYVRYCLSKFYPGRFDKTGPIPAHILGNVWAQKWSNILPIIQKCRNHIESYSMHDEADRKLKRFPVKQMFKMAEQFFTSLGMFRMTEKFWERSVIEQGHNMLMDCHGSAYNFAIHDDFRIKMCTNKNVEDFTTVHHEMGHIEYFMAYRDLHFSLLDAANPGFHEAVGDTIALSVKTPEHLKKIGLISEIPSSSDFDFEYLLITALEKIAFIPFALTMDSYTWGVYNGSVSLDRLNGHWWDLRRRFQGIGPSQTRTENDFDPASKYHMAFGYTYLRYFVSFILQFQFYESMCSLSGYRGPLHRCDFYQSTVAGQRLLKMLGKGRSLHWKDSLEILTGSRDISSKSLMKYFSPLYDWLKETNERLKIHIGW